MITSSVKALRVCSRAKAKASRASIGAISASAKSWDTRSCLMIRQAKTTHWRKDMKMEMERQRKLPGWDARLARKCHQRQRWAQCGEHRRRRPRKRLLTRRRQWQSSHLKKRQASSHWITRKPSNPNKLLRTSTLNWQESGNQRLIYVSLTVKLTSIFQRCSRHAQTKFKVTSCSSNAKVLSSWSVSAYLPKIVWQAYNTVKLLQSLIWPSSRTSTIMKPSQSRSDSQRRCSAKIWLTL